MKTLIDKITARLPKITEKNRNYVLGGVLFGIFLLDYFLIMSPQLRTIMALNPKIAILKKSVKTTNENIAKIDQHRSELAKLKDEMTVLGNTILLREEIPNILKRISLIANETNVNLSQIVPLKNSEKLVLSNDVGKYYSLPMLVTASGGYHDLGRFFNRIERDEIFMSVIDFNIAATDKNLQRHSIKATIKAFGIEK